MIQHYRVWVSFTEQLLTRGTELLRVRPRSPCWPDHLPPSWGASRPVGVFSPVYRWRGWERCTSAGGWWSADRCVDTLAWLLHERPPWSWPENCTRTQRSNYFQKRPLIWNEVIITHTQKHCCVYKCMVQCSHRKITGINVNNITECQKVNIKLKRLYHVSMQTHTQ